MTFSRLFPKQQFIFPDSRLPNNYMIKRDLEKRRNQAFLHDALQTYGNHSANYADIREI